MKHLVRLILHLIFQFIISNSHFSSPLSSLVGKKPFHIHGISSRNLSFHNNFLKVSIDAAVKEM
jgi:hypothetical protein